MGSTERPDLLIIGGGVIGLSIARELHKRGAGKITIVERSTLGCEASYAAAGMLAPNAECEAVDDFHRFCTLSLGMYPDLARELFDETGINIELERTGTLYLAFDQAEAEMLRGRLECHIEAGLGTRLLSPSDVARMEPAIAAGVLEGLLFPHDWQVDNRLLLNALTRYARTAGFDVLENTEVHEIIVENGRAAGVSTSRGDLFADRLVLATGAWASHIKIGGRPTEIAVRPIRGQMLAFDSPDTIRHVIYTAGGYLVPRADGRILVGATVEDAGFDKTVDEAAISQLKREAARIVPRLAAARVLETWAGLRPLSADGLPVIGESPEGVFFATGHFRNGILLAPATAAAAAEHLLGGRLPAVVAPFGPERFRAACTSA